MTHNTIQRTLVQIAIDQVGDSMFARAATWDWDGLVSQIRIVGNAVSEGTMTLSAASAAVENWIIHNQAP